MSKGFIIVTASPDQGTGNDPETLRLAFRQCPTFRNAYCPNCAYCPYGGNDLPRPRRSVLYECLF